MFFFGSRLFLPNGHHSPVIDEPRFPLCLQIRPGTLEQEEDPSDLLFQCFLPFILELESPVARDGVIVSQLDGGLGPLGPSRLRSGGAHHVAGSSATRGHPHSRPCPNVPLRHPLSVH